MKIIVGSKNKAKVDAVAEIIIEYPHLTHADVVGVGSESGVSNQPKSLDESVQGAMNRAKNVFGECDYAIGLESGLMHVPNTKS